MVVTVPNIGRVPSHLVYRIIDLLQLSLLGTNSGHHKVTKVACCLAEEERHSVATEVFGDDVELNAAGTR